MVIMTAIMMVVLYPKDHTAFALTFLSIVFPLMFVLFDWLVLKGEERCVLSQFRIWDAGFILGIGVTVVYLFTKAILMSLEESCGIAMVHRRHKRHQSGRDDILWHKS